MLNGWTDYLKLYAPLHCSSSLPEISKDIPESTPLNLSYKHSIFHMDPRPRPLSSRHGEAEPDIISHQAARLSGGGRSGPGRPSYRSTLDGGGRSGPGISSHRLAVGGGGRSGPGSSSHRSTFGGDDPRSRRPNHPGGALHGNGLGRMYEDEEMDARRNDQGHSGRPLYHSKDIRAPSGVPNSTQGRRHGYAGGEDDLEDRVGSLRHDQPRGDRQSLPREHGRFGGYGGHPSLHDDTGTRPPSRFAEKNQYSEAAGAIPGRHHPASQRHKNNSRGDETFQDNERYGGSRRGGANRARDPSERPYSEPDAGSSRATVERRGTQVHGNSQEEEGRFIPYTFRMLDPIHVEMLVKVFKVRTSKVMEWCAADYIRMDTKKDRETNIDPLLSTLTSKDRERYAALLRRIDNERKIGELTGWGPRHVPTAYERGFYEGIASARRERRGAGYR